jgi:hypothetical protein
MSRHLALRRSNNLIVDWDYSYAKIGIGVFLFRRFSANGSTKKL